MSEKGRERLHWLLSVAVLAVACAHLGRLAQVAWPFTAHASKALIAGVILGAIPLALVVDFVLESFGRAFAGRWPFPAILLRHPTVSCENVAECSSADAAARVEQRLAALRFVSIDTSSGPSGETIISASKPKTEPCHGFLDNAFEASVSLRPAADPRRTVLTATVTERDLVVIETGEREKLGQMAAHLALERDALRIQGVPLTVYTAITLACAGALAQALLPAPSPRQAAAISAALLGAVAYAVVAGVAICQRRERAFGLRLVAAAVVLGALPFAARAVNELRGPALSRVTATQWSVIALAVGMIALMFLAETRARRLAAAGRAGGIGRRVLRRVVMFGGAFGLMLVAMGAMIWSDARRMTERHNITADQLERGTTLPGRWVRVQGWLDVTRSRWVGKRDGREYFIPIVSTPARQPVAAVMRMKQDQFERLRADVGASELIIGEFDGVVQAFEFDAEHRAHFEDNDIPLADDCLEIEYELTPDALASRGQVPIRIGLGVLGVVALVAVISLRPTPNRQVERLMP